MVADTLSRVDALTAPSSIVPIFGTDKILFCDGSTGSPRPFIPLKFRREVFDNFHNLHHPGIKVHVNI